MIDDYEPLIRKRDLKRYKDKDLFETVEEVFDTKTLYTLLSLMRKKIIKRMNGVISAGKESRVYLGFDWRNNPLAVKIYLTSTAVFRKGILKYIIGDPRFENVKISDTRSLIYAWTRKEFRNLKRLYNSGVKVPKPITFLNNVLVMEFIGEDMKRYPLLHEVYNELDILELEKIYKLIINE
ncbi:MAG: serine protein kinase RIO, partial [Thermoprotei archaeon]